MTVAPSTASTLYDYAVELLDACSAALDTTEGGTPDYAAVWPGAPAIDCLPWLSVHVAGIGQEQTSPAVPATAAGHRGRAPGQLLLQTLIVTVARCAPQPDGNSLPSPDAMTEFSKLVAEDGWAIWNHLYQLIRDGDIFGGSCPAVYMDPAAPLAISGQAAGWTIQLRPAINGYIPVP